MITIIKGPANDANIIVDVDAEDISIWHGADLVMLTTADMAKELIDAIKAGSEHLGWDLP
jgi:hypothetical protein